MPPSLIMTDCPDCGCGGQCAQIAVECGCCGHAQFIDGDPGTIQSQFYNWELDCQFCGATWKGHDIDLEYCPSPVTGHNTFSWLGEGTFYRYIGAYSRWYVTEYLEYAIQYRTMGNIFDNCGNVVPIQQ